VKKIVLGIFKHKARIGLKNLINLGFNRMFTIKYSDGILFD